MLKILEGVKHRMVLDGRGDYVPAARSMRPSDSQDREVARLRPTARKDDLMGFDTEHGRQPLPRIVHRCAGFASRSMDARCISERIAQARHHRSEGLWSERRRRVVI